ncbi:GmrSD restriction endonuclease domain-containing protein [Ruminococcus flavefaciens]|uniref:GmrSD restriction endonuclease domain-containing protein n=1 Tax=Ruminococcus flavefaciens TaxID=1265 RepID=UPI003D6DC97C
MDKFEKLSKRDGFYSWESLKFLLYIYDLSLTKTDSEKKINPDEYFKQEPKDHCSIEHIYPQKGTDKYWSDRFDKYSPNERKRLNGSLGNG